jgi:Ca2+/Na+ antiporter
MSRNIRTLAGTVPFSSIKSKVKKWGITDFFGVLMVLWCLVALLFGYETCRSRKYLKMLTSLSSKRTVYISLALSRAIFLIAVYLALIGCTALVFLLSGIPFPFHPPIMVFLFITLLALLFLLFLGFLLGMIKSQFMGVPLVLVCWALLLYLIPTGISLYIADKSNDIISIYEMEMQKLRFIMSIEKKGIEEIGKFDCGKNVTEKDKEFIKKYFENDFKQLNEMEEDLRKHMRYHIRHHNLLSSFLPVTLSIASGEEVSSMGPLSQLEFYHYTQDQKKAFFKYYMDKRFFSGEGNFAKFENFVKNDENIYQSQSRLPYYTGLGILVSLLEILVLLIVGYICFDRMVFEFPKKEVKKIKPREFDFEKKISEAHYLYHEIMSCLLYNVFSGRVNPVRDKGFTGPITIDGVDVISSPLNEPFLYLCAPWDLPGELKAGDVFDLLTVLLRYTGQEKESLKFQFLDQKDMKTSISKLEDYQVCEVLLSALAYKKREIYLVEDTIHRMPTDLAIILDDSMERLSGEDALSIYLTTEDNLPQYRKVEKKYPNQLVRSTTWSEYMKGLKEKYNREKESEKT